jgi:hypothetical protein
MLLVSLAGALLAATALAATPKSGASFRGVGRDYMNNRPKWTAEASGRISFKTSGTGSAVLDFKGTYSYYCGGGNANVTETSMPVSKRGTFGARFSQPIKGKNGKVNSTAYVVISGAFHRGGKKASVSYFIDYVFTGSHVKHPYSTKSPKGLGCATWVRGTATTR